MRALAVPLLALLAATHFGYDVLAMLYEQKALAARAWFYMLRGIEGAALFAVIAGLARNRAVTAVCLLGACEEGLTTACRASRPIGDSLGYAPFAGLCGEEWYFAGLIALGLVALGIAYDLGRGRAKD